MAGKRSYDTAGRVSSTELATYSYDAAGRITGITQQLYAPRDTNPANSGITQTTASWAAGYDATGRLISFVESTVASSTTGPGTSSFSYDSNGNRLSSLHRTLKDSIYNDPTTQRRFFPSNNPTYPGETHMTRDNDLLRLDPAGNFRSLYPLKK